MYGNTYPGMFEIISMVDLDGQLRIQRRMRHIAASVRHTAKRTSVSTQSQTRPREGTVSRLEIWEGKGYLQAECLVPHWFNRILHHLSLFSVTLEIDRAIRITLKSIGFQARQASCLHHSHAQIIGFVRPGCLLEAQLAESRAATLFLQHFVHPVWAVNLAVCQLGPVDGREERMLLDFGTAGAACSNSFGGI